MSISNKIPLVSVRLMTYNHAKYIRQAIEGVLIQQTDFQVELVIGDDFSDDGNLEIIKEYKNTDNISINVLERTAGDSYWQERKKKGRLYNFTNIIDNCKGNYIALLDGDDYWIDPLKLQKQVDYLESNPFVEACYTSAYVLNENSGKKSIHEANYPKLNHKEIISKGGGFFITASLMYRNNKATFPDFFYKAQGGDHALILMISLNGAVHKLNEITTVYRLHNEGIYSSLRDDRAKLNLRKLNTVELLLDFNKFSNMKNDSQIKRKVSSILRSILSNGGIKLFLNKNLEYLKYLSLRDFLGFFKEAIGKKKLSSN